MSDLSLLAIVSGVVLLDFTAGWWFCRRINNYSLVDAFWATWIGLAGIIYAIFGSGEVSKRIAAAGLAAAWGGRLAFHLFKRIWRHHPQEDSRYQKLREIWKGREGAAFFWFFLGQAFSVLLLSIPYLLITRDSSPWGFLESIGLAVALTGLAGEILADHQMAAFKKKDERTTSVCRAGLWNYSRHPNYFFEMIFWLGLFLFACGSPWGWTTFYAPLVITYLLLRVTGIPPTESSALNRKGDAYRDYQRTTSAFIPLPPKNHDHH